MVTPVIELSPQLKQRSNQWADLKSYHMSYGTANTIMYRVFSKFPYLKDKPYWGNHFWAPGYCVDTVGLDAEMIRKYVKYQETKERREEQLQFKF